MVNSANNIIVDRFHWWKVKTFKIDSGLRFYDYVVESIQCTQITT